MRHLGQQIEGGDLIAGLDIIRSYINASHFRGLAPYPGSIDFDNGSLRILQRGNALSDLRMVRQPASVGLKRGTIGVAGSARRVLGRLQKRETLGHYLVTGIAKNLHFFESNRVLLDSFPRGYGLIMDHFAFPLREKKATGPPAFSVDIQAQWAYMMIISKGNGARRWRDQMNNIRPNPMPEIITYILTDKDGRPYFNGQIFYYQEAMKAAHDITERPLGVFICPSEPDTGSDEIYPPK